MVRLHWIYLFKQAPLKLIFQLTSAGVSLVLSIAVFPFCKSGRHRAFCYCSYFCRWLGVKNQLNYGIGSHSTPAAANRWVYTVISQRFMVKAPKPVSGCRWSALEAVRSDPIRSETRGLLQALPLCKLPSNFVALGAVSPRAPGPVAVIGLMESPQLFAFPRVCCCQTSFFPPTPFILFC